MTIRPLENFVASRRRFLQQAGVFAGTLAPFPAWADEFVDLDLPSGPTRMAAAALRSAQFSW